MEVTPARKTFRLVVVSGLVLICLFVTYRYHFLIGKDIVFSHIYYLPIALAGVWWELGALIVSLFLSLYLVFSRLLSDLGPPTGEDLLRCCMFVVVGLAIGVLMRQKNRLQAEALRERERNVRQMTEHLDYVARVSHELRNPLQVILGVAEALPTKETTGERRQLLEMLDRSAGNIRGRIEDLTRER